MQSNNVTIVIVKQDTYLDIIYYKTKIKYWDGEEIIQLNKPGFNIGDILVPLFQQIDKIGDKLEIRLHIENDNTSKSKLQHITDKIELKQSKAKSCRDITSSLKEAKFLNEFLSFHSCEVI